MSGTGQMDFSESFITLKDKTFLSFEVGYPESEPQCVLLGVNNGSYTQNYLYGYFPEKVDESHIATEDMDYRVVYQERMVLLSKWSGCPEKNMRSSLPQEKNI